MIEAMSSVARRWGALTVVVLVIVPGAAAAQTVRFGVDAVGISHAEINENRRVDGAGVGGQITVRVGRFGLELSGYTAQMTDTPEGVQEFDLLQGDVRLSFAIAQSLAIEVGGGRRKVDPEFAAQDIGLGRLGIRSEVQLSRIGSLWGRGAYLLRPQFNGGGEAGLAVELGFGAGLGTANGRFRVRVEYEFQRLDREVGTVKVPIQMTVAKFGVDLGF
jgi:hypothetical protein